MRVFQYRVALLAASLPIALAISACNAPPASAPAPATPAAAPAPSPAERGKMLVIGGAYVSVATFEYSTNKQG